MKNIDFPETEKDLCIKPEKKMQAFNSGEFTVSEITYLCMDW